MRPTRFRDGIPRRWQSFRRPLASLARRCPEAWLRRPGGQPASRASGPGRRRTCTVPGKNRELCRVELQGREHVTGRDRTCDASRFRRALYRLSYGHASPEERSRTGRLLLIREARFSPSSGPGGSRTLEPPLHLPQLPLRRGCFAELSAIRPTDPGRGVEPRSPRSERGVLPVRRSRSGPALRRSRRRPHRTRALLGVHHDAMPTAQDGRGVIGVPDGALGVQLRARGRTVSSYRYAEHARPVAGGGPPGRGRASPSISPSGRSTQQASASPRSRSIPMSRPRRSRTMLSMPLAYSSTLDHRPPVAHIRGGRRPTWRSFGARASRTVRKSPGKSTGVCQRSFPAAMPRVFLSQAGPRFDLDLLQAEHHLLIRR